MVWSRAALLLPLLSACVRQPVHATRSELRLHATALESGSRARVRVVEGGRHDVAPGQRVRVEFGGSARRAAGSCGGPRQRAIRWVLSRSAMRLETCSEPQEPPQVRDLSVRELVAGCGEPPGAHAAPPVAPCLLDDVLGQRLPIGARTRASPNRVARGLGAVMLTGLFGYCIAECDNPPATFGLAALLTGYLLLAQPLAIFSGAP